MKDAAFEAVEMIGLPIAHGQKRSGVAKGAEALRHYGLQQLFSYHGVRLSDWGDLRVQDQDSEVYYYAYEVAKQVLASQRFGLFIGGDHSVAVSTVAAVLERNPQTRVLWIDAHGDINTPNSSPSGNLHGMPVAALTGAVSVRKIKEWQWLQTKLPYKNIAYLGVRSLDPGEEKLLREKDIFCLSSEQIIEKGVEVALRQALDHLDPKGRFPLHVSFDVDVLDPLVVPATGVKEPGGLFAQHVVQLGRLLGALGRVTSMDLVEVNPDLVSSENQLKQSLSVVYFFIDAFLRGALHDEREIPVFQDSVRAPLLL